MTTDGGGAGLTGDWVEQDRPPYFELDITFNVVEAEAAKVVELLRVPE